MRLPVAQVGSYCWYYTTLYHYDWWYGIRTRKQQVFIYRHSVAFRVTAESWVEIHVIFSRALISSIREGETSYDGGDVAICRMMEEMLRYVAEQRREVESYYERAWTLIKRQVPYIPFNFYYRKFGVLCQYGEVNK